MIGLFSAMMRTIWHLPRGKNTNALGERVENSEKIPFLGILIEGSASAKVLEGSLLVDTTTATLWTQNVEIPTEDAVEFSAKKWRVTGRVTLRDVRGEVRGYQHELEKYE